MTLERVIKFLHLTPHSDRLFTKIELSFCRHIKRHEPVAVTNTLTHSKIVISRQRLDSRLHLIFLKRALIWLKKFSESFLKILKVFPSFSQICLNVLAIFHSFVKVVLVVVNQNVFKSILTHLFKCIGEVIPEEIFNEGVPVASDILAKVLHRKHTLSQVCDKIFQTRQTQMSIQNEIHLFGHLLTSGLSRIVCRSKTAQSLMLMIGLLAGFLFELFCYWAVKLG